MSWGSSFLFGVSTPEWLCMEAKVYENPAKALADLFTQWNEDYVHNSFAFEDYPIEEGQRAVVYLSQIVRYLEKTKTLIPNIGIYEKHAVQWLVSCGAPYSSPNHAGELVPQNSIDILQALSTVIDIQSQNLRTPIAEKNREEFEAKIRELADAVEDDQTLDANLKSHLRALLDHLLECLASLETTGQFDLGEAFNKLRIYVGAAAYQSQHKNSQKIYDRFLSFGLDLASNVASNLVVAALPAA